VLIIIGMEDNKQAGSQIPTTLWGRRLPLPEKRNHKEHL